MKSALAGAVVLCTLFLSSPAGADGEGSHGGLGGGATVTTSGTRTDTGAQATVGAGSQQSVIPTSGRNAHRGKGAGKVTYHGFTQDELNIDITGSGDVDLEGKAERLEAEISGSGEVSAYKLTAKTARLRVSGSGDIRATVTQSVRARVSGSGKIKISGNPAERDTDVSGSGKIKFTQFVDNN